MTQPSVKLFIDVTAMTKFNNDNGQFIIFKLANNTIIFNSIAPKTSKILSERLTKTPWIGLLQYSIFKIINEFSFYFTSQFTKLLVGCCRKQKFPRLIRHQANRVVFSILLMYMLALAHFLPAQQHVKHYYSLHNHREILQERVARHILYSDGYWPSIDLSAVQVGKVD